MLVFLYAFLLLCVFKLGEQRNLARKLSFDCDVQELLVEDVAQPLIGDLPLDENILGVCMR
jgi:hypothetical protein